jgi:hypothetical protein
MTLPISIAEKLHRMLKDESTIPSSAFKGMVLEKMVNDGVLQKRLEGKSKAVIFISDAGALKSYLSNHFGIADLEKYISVYRNEGLTRSEAISVSGNSKLRGVRTFKGFVVNSFMPVDAVLNGASITIHPTPGSFIFISDWESFVPGPTVTIVGIENPENFRQVQRQQYLFSGIQPIFICRYPQSNDAIKWLQGIPNPYLHFGDLDFSGINIYLNEYRKWLGEKASFFVPPNISEMLQLHGNRELYNRQLHLAPEASLMEDENIRNLIGLLHRHKKVLEQEIFIRK